MAPPSLNDLGLGAVRHLLRVDGRKEIPVKVLEKALIAGMTFVDVTRCCTCPEVGRLLRRHREQVTIAAQFELAGSESQEAATKSPGHAVRESCEKILGSLGVDAIDLFYQSDGDCETSILDAMLELQALVTEGKIRCIGLAACDPGILRQAHAMHPISAVTVPWCLWGAGKNLPLINTCRELGISILATDPLGWGLIPTSWTEPADVRSKVSAIVARQHKMLQERVEKIQSKPGHILRKRAKAAALSQSGKVDAFIKRIFARQDSVFLEKLKNRVAEKQGALVTRIEMIMEKHRKKMYDLLETTLDENFNTLCRRLNALDGKSDTQIPGVVERVLLCLTGRIISQVLALRSQQREFLLEKLKRRTGDKSSVSKLTAKMFAMHKETALSRIQGFRAGQVNFLVGRLRTIQAKKRSRSVESVRTAIVRRHEAMAQRVSEVLGKRSRLELPCAISGVIDTKCNKLKVRMTRGSEFCFDNMSARCERVTSRQEPKIVDTIHKVMERRTEKLVQRALLVTGEPSMEADDLALEKRTDVGKRVLEKGSVLNRRMRRIARGKGCDADVLALAWLRVQEGDVFVVNRVSGTKGVLRAGEANHLKISEDELARFTKALNEFRKAPDDSSEWVEVQKEDDWEVVSID
ncbi:hypothetical protein BSKO_03022 [Bryopsis sp. KO-2023]|nr:hypothetical protein BSKO_03022 [Bryopsis sp. KO-2023]